MATADELRALTGLIDEVDDNSNGDDGDNNRISRRGKGCLWAVGGLALAAAAYIGFTVYDPFNVFGSKKYHSFRPTPRLNSGDVRDKLAETKKAHIDELVSGIAAIDTDTLTEENIRAKVTEEVDQRDNAIYAFLNESEKVEKERLHAQRLTEEEYERTRENYQELDVGWGNDLEVSNDYTHVLVNHARFYLPETEDTKKRLENTTKVEQFLNRWRLLKIKREGLGKIVPKYIIYDSEIEDALKILAGADSSGDQSYFISQEELDNAPGLIDSHE